MSLYPSLEDMKVDQMVRAQLKDESSYSGPPRSPSVSAPVSASLPYPLVPSAPAGSLYPSLGEFMGLEFTELVIAQNMPEYAVAVPQSRDVALPSVNISPISGMIAPLSGQSLGLQRAQVTHGIRELTLCKDAVGKVGLRVRSVDKGIFVCLVTKGSPAALAGLRFGDQILEINGITVAGFSMDEVHDLFRKSPINGIKVVVRDRPFERSITLHKDSVGHVGFSFKNGKIIGLVKDSSAARNGLLVNHYLLEVNGQNVVTLKDKEITGVIEQGGQVITVTVIPAFIYEHMTSKISTNLLKGAMDHSIPSL